MIYLDYAANYPVKKEVLDALCQAELSYRGNANSLHLAGAQAKEEYERVNDRMYELLGLDKSEYEIIYTSSATESNNTAIKGIYDAYSGFGSKILCSEFEHSSVNASLSYLKDRGAEITLLKTGPDGKMDLADLKDKLNDEVILVCLALVESEVGTIQDYKAVMEVLKDYPNAHFFLDATQAIGKFDVDLSGVDLVSFTPHKFGGLSGTGVLVRKRSVILTPLLHGGKSASLYRSGTIPLGLIVSTQKALELAMNSKDENMKKVKVLHAALMEGLSSIEGVTINSLPGNPYITNISISGKLGGATVSCLSSKGICVSQKSACSVPNTRSKPLMAIYHDKKRALSSIRLSISELTTLDEISAVVSAIKEYR